jgi:regulator of protease activity HflC (stomatin/prohibitin superfamily)
VVKDTVVPWRRKHAETMARLLEQEKLAEIESKKAEVLEKRANAAKGRAEAEKLTTEAVKQREEAEKMKLENEKMQLELHRARIQLGSDIINEFAPNLPETDRITYLIRLLPALNTVIASNLQIVDDTAKNTN